MNCELKLIGITGPIGSGKSALREIFTEFGIEVIDCDVLAREIVLPGSPALLELAAEFGEDIINPDGTLNRAELAGKAFSSGGKAARLNEITHFRVLRLLKERLAKLPPDSAVAVEVQLLFEAGWEHMFDCIIAVTADRDVRAKRIARRDNISAGEAERRISAQKDSIFYIERAHYNIENNGTADEFKEKARAVIRGIFHG